MSGSTKKENPRDNSFQFTVTHEEALAVMEALKEAKAKSRSLTMSGFLRDIVMYQVEQEAERSA